eukprot:TRINITY_DN1471_c0_g1_i2.p5 TRINITY_DN1471_c0_g1~~TRINITY_DN1471_c0_g1_i2.p5  ORF type:complete len:129 (+),score=21.95 TRINITY_DN1471_c0_g1_i2:125-511(+)
MVIKCIRVKRETAPKPAHNSVQFKVVNETFIPIIDKEDSQKEKKRTARVGKGSKIESKVVYQSAVPLIEHANTVPNGGNNINGLHEKGMKKAKESLRDMKVPMNKKEVQDKDSFEEYSENLLQAAMYT